MGRLFLRVIILLALVSIAQDIPPPPEPAEAKNTVHLMLYPSAEDLTVRADALAKAGR